MPYVKKVEDEMTTNRREQDTKLITGFMPQILNATTQVLPCLHLQNYIRSLNPKCNALWQKTEL